MRELTGAIVPDAEPAAAWLPRSTVLFCVVLLLAACDRKSSPTAQPATTTAPAVAPLAGAGQDKAAVPSVPVDAADAVGEVPPPGWVWRRNPGEGVAVAAPQRWVFFEKVFREQNDAVIVLYPPAESLLRPAEAHLSVRVHVLPEGVAFGQYVLGHERESTQRQGSRVLTSDGTTVRGWPAHRWTFDGSADGEPRKLLTYAVERGGRVYHMEFLAPEATYTRYAADAERVMKSLRDVADAKDAGGGGDTGPGKPAPLVLRSEDGRTELKLPPGWAAKSPVARGAILQAHRLAESLTAMVVRVGASEQVRDLRATAEKKARGLAAVLDDTTVSAPEALEVNGRRAARCHVTGVTQNIRLAYDVYAVDTGAFIHAMTVSSLESYYESRKAELTKAVQGLSEVEPGAAPPGDGGSKG